ncbi:septum formation family protein [Nocardiopsis alba ATCC BAA-2165]|uniref:Septum formation family protein n=1 Tax=Nocardiopsis alba (strain ATCC BAA-2165 / BE74) TaxID=1205910 RepID=J7L730_NOCAA|nr:septum formation family protein [Nocardiopsis alba ATCC BAA-2165]
MPALSPALRNISLTVGAVAATFALSSCGIAQSIIQEAANGADGGSGGTTGTDSDTGNIGSNENNVMELTVGDCFNESEMNSALMSSEVQGIPLIDCSEPHDSEFFYSEILPEGDFPGTESVNASAEEACFGQPFTDFVGVEFAVSEIYASFLTPIEAGWEAGDREILCYVMLPDETTTGTLEGAGR